MALTSERYAEVDAELQQIQDHLTLLTAELSGAMEEDDLAFTVSAVNFATAHIVYTRRMLELAQMKSRSAKRLRKRPAPPSA